MTVHTETSILLALLAEELAERKLATHGDRRGVLYLFCGLVDAILTLSLLCFATRLGPLCNAHHLVGRLDSAVCSRGWRWVGEDPDAVDLIALQNDVWVRDLHDLWAGHVDVEVVESAAVEDDDAEAVGANGRRRQLAYEQRALNADFFPLLCLEVERVQRCVWGHVLDGEEVRILATQDGEVELFVGARGWRGQVDCGRRSVCLVV